ncbi:MAG: IS1634 family transposase, partial [Acetobacteraceae bacterium]
SLAARRKAASKRTDDGPPVHSFHSLLSELAIFTRNIMALPCAPKDHFLLDPQPTPVQARSFELLGVPPRP